MDTVPKIRGKGKRSTDDGERGNNEKTKWTDRIWLSRETSAALSGTAPHREVHLENAENN